MIYYSIYIQCAIFVPKDFEMPKELEYCLGWCKLAGVEISTTDHGNSYTSTLKKANLLDGKKTSPVPEIGGKTGDASVINLFRHLKGKTIKTWRGNFNTPYFVEGMQ